jgi:1-deoxy-D-xylulose-5-phosphate synthase
MVAPALEAARELASDGIEATVVNARFAKPLDSELIFDLAKRIEHIVTIEENVLIGGFGSNVAGLIQKYRVISARVTNIGLPDDFINIGSQDILRSKYGLDAKGIAQQVAALFQKPSPDSLYLSSFNV